MKIILIPFAWLLRTLYQVFGNYGVALICSFPDYQGDSSAL